jgi:TPR repeat protein
MKAASTDNTNAQFNIGELYHHGRGVPQDYKRAMSWYLKAVKNGNTNAMYHIGIMYYTGQGVTRNIRTAIKWYTKAANQGDSSAQYKLGWIYEYEDGFKDLAKAVNWYQKAATSNHYGAKDCIKELKKQGYFAEQGRKGIECCYLFKDKY